MSDKIKKDNKTDVYSYKINRNDPHDLIKLREKSFKRFNELNWPKPSEEEWRRSDISDIDFKSYVNRDSLSFDCSEVSRTSSFFKAENYSASLFFKDSECSFYELDSELKGKGVYFSSIIDAFENLDKNDNKLKILYAILDKAINRADNRFEVWNYSLFSHGAFLYVPSGLEIDKPVYLDFSESGRKILSSPFLAVYLEKDSSLKLLSNLYSSQKEDFLCNNAFSFHISDNSKLEYFSVQDLNDEALFFSNGSVDLGRDAYYKSLESNFGSSFSKTRVKLNLNGRGSDANIDGIYFAKDDQHMDLRTVQNHNAPNAGSRAFYKGAVSQSSRAIYQGLIYVDGKASKTDAYLTNKNLILNDGARADSIPGLNIETNDVKCSHGSTTGKINAEQLFYLMSRGYSKFEAEKILITGFFEDLYSDSPEDLKNYLEDEIQKRIVNTEV